MILQGTAATISVTVYVDGTPAALASNGTVTVRNELGNAIATGAGSTGGTGIVTFPLTPAHTAQVNRLTVTWADLELAAGGDPFDLTTTEEVVGEVLFTEAEARAYDGAKLSSPSSYPDSVIQRARDRIAEAFARILGYNVGRRFGLEVVDGAGGDLLWLPDAWHLQTVRSIETRASGSTTWTAFSGDQLAGVIAYPNGLLVHEAGSWPVGRRNVRVAYEAGRTIPLELKEAALRVLRDQLPGSNIPDRALRQTDEIGTFDLVIAGGSFGKWFGVPPVDAVLQRYREKVPVAY